MGLLRVERLDGVVELSLTTREARLTPDLHAEAAALVCEIDQDETVRVVLLRSEGADFCRGASEPSAADGVIEAIASLRVPVIALVQGRALDEGFELMLAADLCLASVDAKFGLTQVTQGRFPCHGGTQRLPRRVGVAWALRLILLGELLSARRAVSLGLALRAVPRSRLRALGRALAREVAERGPIAQRFAKEALRAAGDLPLAEGLRLEGDLYVLLQSTEDRREGIASFHARRRPRFVGR